MRLPLVLALGSVLLLAGSAGASSKGSQPGATASAYGIRVVVPGQAGGSSTSVSAPPNASGSAGGFAYPSDGSAVTTGALTASASTSIAATAHSLATISVSSFSLFGGEVTASSITRRAGSGTRGQSATGSLAGSSVTGLTVGGAAQTASPNGRVSLGDWGYAITLEQATVQGAGNSQTYRGYVTGLDVHLTSEHGGLPAGSEILVGYAETWVQAGTRADFQADPVRAPAAAHGRRLRLPGVRAPFVQRYVRCLPRRRAGQLASRRRHLRAARGSHPRLRRRRDLLRRLEQRRRQPAVVARRGGQRVLLRTSLGLFACGAQREPRQGRRGDRLCRQHGRR